MKITLYLPGLEDRQFISNSDVISEVQVRWKDDPEVVSLCSCERLHQHKQVLSVNFTCDKKYHTDIWMRLRAYLAMHDFKILGRKK